VSASAGYIQVTADLKAVKTREIGRSDLLPSIAILLIVLFHAATSVVLMVDGAAQYTECSLALFLEVRLLNFKSGLDQTR
jgi:hypothetical protein